MLRAVLMGLLLSGAISAQAEEARPGVVRPGPPPAGFLQWVWEQEPQVVQIGVGQVTPSLIEPGACLVRGVVQEVWRGDAFRPGDKVSVDVPCDARARLHKSGPVEPAIDPRLLADGTRACVHIHRNGRLIWSQTGKGLGPCSFVSGYTPIDPPPLPLEPVRWR